MHALVPVWRVDTDSARALYRFSESLSDDDVIKAVEQVRHQRAGTTQMPPWLQALAGFAWLPLGASDPQWFEERNEVELLEQLLALLQADAHPIAVFQDAQGIARQIKLRLLVKGFAGTAAAAWSERFCDGSDWQPAGLGAEKDAAAAVLALATGQSLFSPWQTIGMTSTQACEQTLALAKLHKKDWI